MNELGLVMFLIAGNFVSENEPKKWMISEVVIFFFNSNFHQTSFMDRKRLGQRLFSYFSNSRSILRVKHVLIFWNKNGTRCVQCWISWPTDNVQTYPIRQMKGIIHGFQGKKDILDISIGSRAIDFLSWANGFAQGSPAWVILTLSFKYVEIYMFRHLWIKLQVRFMPQIKIKWI